MGDATAIISPMSKIQIAKQICCILSKSATFEQEFSQKLEYVVNLAPH